MQVVWMPGGVRTEIHLGGEDTGGGFCLLVDEPPQGWSLPLHRHANESETIHVVAGEFEMQIDGETVAMAAGETVHVPRGVPHAGRNVGAGTGRRVIVFSPSGIERFFREVGAAAPEEQAEVSSVLAAAGRHGWRFG